MPHTTKCRIRRRHLVAVVCLVELCLAVGPLDGRVVRARSLSQRDVQQAVNAARDGDTVLVPPGTAKWGTHRPGVPAVQLNQKSILLKGAGIDKTVIIDATGNEKNEVMLQVRGTRGKSFRITGITFKGMARGTLIQPAIEVYGTCHRWRIDHCKFEGTGEKNGRGIFVYDNAFGLIDNCTFTNCSQGVALIGNGDKTWRRPLALGTQYAIYIEDCVFEQNNAQRAWVVDGYHGARYVIRHNRITNCVITFHGLDSGRYRSTFSYEIYDNVMTNKSNPRYPRAMHFRGGTGVVFNNKMAGYDTGINVANYRSSDTMGNGLCKNWGPANGKNPIDGNEDPSGYPCRDQIGRSTNQKLEPLYEWDNTLNGQDVDIDVNMLDRILPHEICHLVLAERFGDAHCPLPLNEGLAMMAETTLHNDRIRLAAAALASHRKIPLRRLLAATRVQADDAAVFYAESHSLVSFLHARLTARQFRDLLANLKDGCPFGDALQRALYLPPDEDFLPRLADAWAAEAIRQGQFLKALDTGLSATR